MKKYLFIMANEGHRWGGSEPLWSSAAEKLVCRGNEVRVSVKDWGQPVPQIEKLRLAGCQIFYRDYSIPPFFTRQIRKIFPIPDYQLTHVRTAAAEVDLVVISQGDNMDGLVWMEASQAARLKYAVIAQSAVVYWWPHDEYAERLGRGYESASAAYFVSRANLELSRQQFGSLPRNVKVIRNPFNVSYDVNLPWPPEYSEGLSLACIGRLDIISKGHDLLLNVLGLRHWRERNIRLSVVGKGPHERGLHRLAEELRLSNVTFLGQKEDIEDIWRTHHALVLASRFEGMPLVLVEAMLCGRPCIATDVGGIRELIRDGVNGFIAKAASVELLDEAMNRAWEDRSCLLEMGKIAAADVRQYVCRDPAEEFVRELTALVDG
jgi:glycosyltransferase involved in cell wall biosynthesis